MTGGLSDGSLLALRVRDANAVPASRLPGLVIGDGAVLDSARSAIASSVRLLHIDSVLRRICRSSAGDIGDLIPVELS